MAYISAKDVAAIRSELKAAFPKFKFAVRKENSLAVNVSIMRATFSFDDQFKTSYNGKRYAQVNNYWIDSHFQDYEERAFITKVNEIMHNAPGRADASRKYFDESDAMTDYFHTAFYTHLQIGQWDKEYECVEG